MATERFCGVCGAPRTSSADRFCRACGGAYNLSSDRTSTPLAPTSQVSAVAGTFAPGSFVDRNVQRCNHNLLLTNIGLLVAVLVFTYTQLRLLYNGLNGPFIETPDELLSITNPDLLQEYFVTVHGDSGTLIGTEANRGVARADFRIILVGSRLLLTRVWPGKTDPTITGALVTMPPDVARDVSSPFVRLNPGMPALLPYMLDAAQDFRAGGYFTFALLGACLILALSNLSKWWGRVVRPQTHPVVQVISQIGPLDDVVASIEREVIADHQITDTYNRIITANWILAPKTYGLDTMNIDMIVWVYPKVTKYFWYWIIPTGRQYQSLILRDALGQSAELYVSSPDGWQRRVPWALFGYSKEIRQHWDKRRSGFIAEVEARKQRWRADDTPQGR